VFERFIAGTKLLMRVPVLFDSPEWEQGGMYGRIMTIMTLPPHEWDSGQVGEIIWLSSEEEKKTGGS
jgi:hypothetical protein